MTEDNNPEVTNEVVAELLSRRGTLCNIDWSTCILGSRTKSVVQQHLHAYQAVIYW